jgi:plastocyanin
MRLRFLAALSSAALLMVGASVANPAFVSASGPATITADMPSAVPAGRFWSFNDFFPRTLAVPTGTNVTFVNQGFHTFTLLPAGVTARQDEHTNGVAINDTDDSGRNLNGSTHSEFNVAALGPTSVACGSPTHPCGFDGSAVVSSGAPLAGPPAPFVVHVSAAPGSYVFHCRVHAGMTGRLNVLPADAKGPSASQVAKQVAQQVKRDLKGARAADHRASHLGRVRNADGTTTWRIIAGTSSADGRVALLEFLPKTLDIKPGDRVFFVPRSPNEPHTVTFPGDLGTEFVPFCEAGSTDIAVGPTGCNFGPPDELELDGGNGVRNVTTPTTVSDSGIIGPRRLTALIGLPSTAVLHTWTVSFAGAQTGAYTYVCQIHDGMGATINIH